VSDRPRAYVVGASGTVPISANCSWTRGYEVAGSVRPGADLSRLDRVRERIGLAHLDVTDTEAQPRAIREFEPREIYNVSAASFGPDAWDDPARIARVNGLAVSGLLDAACAAGARFFQASSAWVFGRPEREPQDETTPYAPIEPYGAAKAYADFLVRAYRARHDLFACSGILFNHESPRRPERFVTRKITRAAAEISRGLRDELVLGDLYSRRDWGFAPDYVRAAT
jgi:GDPmannose 4,6-dehydratase